MGWADAEGGVSLLKQAAGRTEGLALLVKMRWMR